MSTNQPNFDELMKKLGVILIGSLLVFFLLIIIFPNYFNFILEGITYSLFEDIGRTLLMLLLLFVFTVICFILGIQFTLMYYEPASIHENIEIPESIINHNFSKNDPIINFEIALDLIEDVDGYIDAMNPSQLKMTSEKLKQVFQQVEAIEIMEIREMEKEEEEKVQLKETQEDLDSKFITPNDEIDENIISEEQEEQEDEQDIPEQENDEIDENEEQEDEQEEQEDEQEIVPEQEQEEQEE